MILARKARKLRRETGNEDLRAEHEVPFSRYDFIRAILRPLRMLAPNRRSFYLALIRAINESFMSLMFSSICGIFEDRYSFRRERGGLLYVSLFLGHLLSGIILQLALCRSLHGLERTYSIFWMLPGFVIIPAALAGFGWCVQTSAHWVYPLLCLAFLSLGTQLNRVSEGSKFHC